MKSAIIVAAGLSRRMGEENKLLLPFQGKALFLHLTDEVLRSEVEEIIVVIGYESEKIIKALGERNVKIIYNTNYKEGLTSSIQAGVLASNKNTKGYLICLSDMPFVKTKHINLILNKIENNYSIIIPKINNKKSHPIFLSQAYRSEILNHKNPNGCKLIIENNKEQIKFISFEEDFSQDIDTPEAYRILHERNQ
ncbi:MAG: molybdenum cofactor cytidylyltransferase [Maribacter sp.]|jgi:molybdenum cofactor cytidylyltransferase